MPHSRPVTRVLGLVVTLVGLHACHLEHEDPGSAPMSWEEFRAGARVHPDYDDTYIVDGDIRLHGEDALRAFYDRHIATVRPRAAFGTPFGEVQQLRADIKLSLSYCVSNHPDSFADPAEHAHVVESMRRAALTWERATDVNFMHMPEWDGDCEDHDPDGPRFRLVKNTIDGCQANAFGPTTLTNPFGAELREIDISQDAVYDCHEGGLTKALTHELGHVLGLQHEHWRDDAVNINNALGCAPFEIYDFPVSEFDWNSVMFYDHCGQGAGNTRASRRDVAGARFTYTLPKHGWLARRAGDLVSQWSNFDPIGRTDVYWYRPDPDESDSFMLGNPNAVDHADAVTSAIGERHRPIAGDFDGDLDTDILFYSDGDPDQTDYLLRKQDGWGNYDWTVTQLPIGPYYQPVVGNFLGSWRTDIFLYGPGDRPDMLLTPDRFAEFTIYPQDIGTADDFYSVIPGDFDGDGDTDLFFYNSDEEGRRALSLHWSSNGDGTFTESAIAHESKGLTGGNTAAYFYSWVTGDFNGDDRGDIVFYAPGQPVKIWLGGAAGPGTTVVTANIVGDYKLFAADFNADAITDLFWYGQGGAADVIWRMDADANHASLPQHVPNDDLVPVLGDFNGDLRADIYWHDPVGVDVLWRAGPVDQFWLENVPQTFSGWPVGYSLQ